MNYGGCCPENLGAVCGGSHNRSTGDAERRRWAQAYHPANARRAARWGPELLRYRRHGDPDRPVRIVAESPAGAVSPRLAPSGLRVGPLDQADIEPRPDHMPHHAPARHQVPYVSPLDRRRTMRRVGLMAASSSCASVNATGAGRFRGRAGRLLRPLQSPEPRHGARR